MAGQAGLGQDGPRAVLRDTGRVRRRKPTGSAEDMEKAREISAYVCRRWCYAVLAIALALGAWLIVDPSLDLAASALFYRPGEGFAADHSPLLSAVRHVGNLLGKVFGAAIGVAVLFRIVTRRDALGIPMRALVFLAAVQIAGPAVLVNAVLKEHWGRARPVQITEFGGTKHYTPPLIPADQCAHNCSFVSGEASFGFSFLAFGFLPRTRRWRQAGFAFGAAFGSALGVMRIAQGGHFMSDIVFSAALMLLVAWVLERLILDPRSIAWFDRITQLGRRQSADG